MKVVFVSASGETLPLAERIEEEGNMVVYCNCREANSVDVEKVIGSHPDIIIFDGIGFSSLSHKFSKLKIPVLGSSNFSDELNGDGKYRDIILSMFKMEKTTSPPNITIEGWFNGEDYLAILYYADRVVIPGKDSSFLYKASLAKILPTLRKTGYRGPVRMDLLVSEDSMKVAGIGAGISYITVLAIREGVKGRVTNLLISMANGIRKKPPIKEGFYISIDVLVAPPPILLNGFLPRRVEGIEKGNLRHVWLFGAKEVESGVYEVINSSRVLTITSRGDTLREARRRVYRTISNIQIDEMAYTKKVGSTAAKTLMELQSWQLI